MNHVVSIFKNKFVIATIIFLFWIFLFAQYDVITQQRHRTELNEMNAKIDFLHKEIERLQSERDALKADPRTLEQYAREKYFMKTVHEDVYVFDTIKQ